MIRKPLTWLLLILGAMLVLGEVPPANAQWGSIAGMIGKHLKTVPKKTPKQAPKQADDLSSLKGSSKPKDDELILDGPLITRSFARASHVRTCPTMRLRVSLPQLNVLVTFPSKLNIRGGPSTKYRAHNRVDRAGTYTVDLVTTKGCWVLIRYKVPNGGVGAGWVYAKHTTFEFDNHLSRPNRPKYRVLDTDDLYNLVATSTYKIKTPTSQGTAVAISPSVLLTNCHVLGRNRNVKIIERGRRHLAWLIHDDHSKDKCFIRSLTLEVRPVPNVKSYESIRQGEPAYSVGAPGGRNRTMGTGNISAKGWIAKTRYVQTTAFIAPGSSGGGLFDNKGNLLGITTSTAGPGLNFAIAAEDFWR